MRFDSIASRTFPFTAYLSKVVRVLRGNRLHSYPHAQHENKHCELLPDALWRHEFSIGWLWKLEHDKRRYTLCKTLTLGTLPRQGQNDNTTRTVREERGKETDLRVWLVS
jgi:hypothetical protein